MATQLSRIVADFETSLSGAVSVGDSSFTIQSVTDDDSVTLSDGIYCFTLDRDNSSSKEYIVGQLTNATKTVSSISSVSRQGALTSNFQKAHRIGTNVIISDHSALNAIVKILNGTGTLDSGSPIGYDSTATISGANMLATKAYVDSVVNGGTVTYDKQILSSQTAGETLAAGNIVYLKAADSRWWLADADVLASYDQVQLGVALGAGTAGNTISGGVQISGACSAFTGLTANTLYYLSSTAGGVSTSAGTPKISIGVATTTTTISLDFKNYSRLTGAEKDALAGGGAIGTPSTSNKFISETYWTNNFIMDTGLVSHTKTTVGPTGSTSTETTVYTKAISAGLLSTTDGLCIDFSGAFATTAVNDTPEVSIYFDSTQMAVIQVNTVDLSGGGSAGCNFTGRIFIINNASASAQNVFGNLIGLEAGLRTDVAASTIYGTVNTTKTFDTSNAFTLTIRMKNENSDATETFTFDWAAITKLGLL